MNKLIILFLLPINMWAQDFINSSDFNNKIAKGVTVVEFWAEWNKSNQVEFLGKLKGCNSYKLCIVKNSDIKNEYNVSAIPTLIVFENGKEKNRFMPNIMMKLNAVKKDVQGVIDNIALSKFE